MKPIGLFLPRAASPVNRAAARPGGPGREGSDTNLTETPWIGSPDRRRSTSTRGIPPRRMGAGDEQSVAAPDARRVHSSGGEPTIVDGQHEPKADGHDANRSWIRIDAGDGILLREHGWSRRRGARGGARIRVADAAGAGAATCRAPQRPMVRGRANAPPRGSGRKVQVLRSPLGLSVHGSGPQGTALPRGL